MTRRNTPMHNYGPFLLSSAGKDYLWGRTRMKADFAKDVDMTPLGGNAGAFHAHGRFQPYRQRFLCGTGSFRRHQGAPRVLGDHKKQLRTAHSRRDDRCQAKEETPSTDQEDSCGAAADGGSLRYRGGMSLYRCHAHRLPGGSGDVALINPYTVIRTGLECLSELTGRFADLDFVPSAYQYGVSGAYQNTKEDEGCMEVC